MNQIPIGALKAVARVNRPNQRALAKQRTRERILTAATTLFSERGYEGATIRDIAKEAGMSTGAVFASFSDKSDLFGEIVASEREALETLMREAAAERGAKPAVVAMFEAAADRHMADLALFQATMSTLWTPDLGPDVRRRLKRRPASAIVAEGLTLDIGCGEMSADRTLVAELLWDSYISALRRAALENLTLEAVKARVGEQVAIILAGARRA